MSEDLFNSLQSEKAATERERERLVTDAIAKMREELVKQQAEQARLEAEKEKPLPKKEEETGYLVSNNQMAPLVYLSYPLTPNQNPHPAWVAPVRTALVKSGYHVYTPWVSVDEQFKDNSSVLDAMPKKLVKQLCPAYRIQEELMLDYNIVYPTFSRADLAGDYDCIVFRNLWFLLRSSLVIADLTTPERLGLCGVIPELLYSRLLDIPSIGVAAESGYSNPWLNHCTSVLYTGQFNLTKFFPLISGFAPLPA